MRLRPPKDAAQHTHRWANPARTVCGAPTNAVTLVPGWPSCYGCRQRLLANRNIILDIPREERLRDYYEVTDR